MDTDPDIRNQIIILDDCHENILKTKSNIELSARYSSNTNNFEIFKKLLLNSKNKDEIINELLIMITQYSETTSNIEAIKLLIELGADINYKDKNNYTALHYSCIFPMGRLEIIEFLIKNGANVNNKSGFLRTPLMVLLFNPQFDHDLKIMTLLISKGVHSDSIRNGMQSCNQINYRDIHGYTSLMIYIKNNQPKKIRYDIIKLLLDNKADIYIKTNQGKNILSVIEDKIGKNSDIYSLIFNYKNLPNDHFCEFDIDFIYNLI